MKACVVNNKSFHKSSHSSLGKRDVMLEALLWICSKRKERERSTISKKMFVPFDYFVPGNYFNVTKQKMYKKEKNEQRETQHLT